MPKDKPESIKQLDGALIVSSQASPGEPLAFPEHLLAMALSAINGGARGVRLEGIESIAAARQDPRMPANVPIIGLIKSDNVAADDRLRIPYITNHYEDAQALASAGADIVAVDATGRPRSDGFTLAEVIRLIHGELNKPVWADVATFDEGMKAVASGADIISTTLFGYTEETAKEPGQGPSFSLLKMLIQHSPVPVILEGRVWHPDEVTRAFELGAYAVVVGSAITRPQLIAERFVKAIPSDRRRGAVVN
jgi:putative N-acetylmannosamine-6-phosphate epimerase